jgi:3-methyladenine DNA glycosylase AlkD
MTYDQVMKELKKMGTAQNRKVYGRHGVKDAMFGVSYANLNALKKKIKTDHDLAVKLWESGNHDARVLATMIADPARLKSATLDQWVRDLDNYVLTDALSSLAGKTSHIHQKMQKWTKSKQEWVARTGWALLARLSTVDDDLPDAFFDEYLGVIESNIHTSKNRVRDAMNSAVINIGLRNANLEKRAIAAAKRIGKVDVDHGQTGCKTPDAIEYINKTKEHRRRKAAKKKPR